MAYRRQTLDEHLCSDGRPKRILAVDECDVKSRDFPAVFDPPPH